MQTDHRLRHNKPDYPIEIAVPPAHKIAEKQTEKIRKYLSLASEIKTLWNQERVSINPIISFEKWEISNNLLRYFKQLKLIPKLYLTVQKLAILESCHIVRKFQNMST